MVHPILVCTYTNVAVDNLVEGFVTAGLDPVRIGYGQTKSTLQEHSLESKIEKHPLYAKYELASKELKKLEKDLKQTHTRISEQRNKRGHSGELSRLKCYLEYLNTKRLRFRSNEQVLYRQIRSEVLTSADVVRFFIAYISSDLISAVRYAPLVSVQGLCRWTSWTSPWSSWMRLQCRQNLPPSFLS